MKKIKIFQHWEIATMEKEVNKFINSLPENTNYTLHQSQSPYVITKKPDFEKLNIIITITILYW